MFLIAVVLANMSLDSPPRPRLAAARSGQVGRDGSGETEPALRQRKHPQPLAGGCENRVGDGRQHRRQRRFAQASRRIVCQHEVHVNVRRRLPDPDRLIGVEVLGSASRTPGPPSATRSRCDHVSEENRSANAVAEWLRGTPRPRERPWGQPILRTHWPLRRLGTCRDDPSYCEEDVFSGSSVAVV